MFIEKYSASKLRGINLITLHPSKFVNIIVGNNNACKTSLLEGIYYCSSLKSFKAVSSDTLIQNNEKTLKLLLNVNKSSEKATIYTEKSFTSPNLVKINDKRVNTKTLMLGLPCIALSFGVENIILQSSEQRRGFLDWGAFHVEPSHLFNFKNYTKTLKQRNTLLKKNDETGLEYWTEELCRQGMILHDQRSEYFTDLNQEFINYIDRLTLLDESTYADIKNTVIKYSQGWTDGSTLKSALLSSYKKDLVMKHTTVGPHRADVTFTSNKLDLKNISSMSTQIIVSLLLVLSQAEVFHVKHGFRPIILIDDLFFGIDDKNLRLVINLLVGSKTQCFITAPDLYKEKIKSLGETASAVRLYEFVDGELKEGS